MEPEAGSEFLSESRAKRVGAGFFAEHCEDGRARAGEERAGDFGLGEQPHFELREEKVFLEDGTFEIVDERPPRKFLRGVADAGDYERVAPLPVGPRRRDAEGRLDEQQRERVRKIGGRDFFPAPGHARGGAFEEKGNVGADAGGETVERFARGVRGEDSVEREERGGGVAAAATESRAVRDFFAQADAQAVRDFESVAKCAGGADDEIRVVGGKVRLVAGEFDAACVARFDFQTVEKRDGDDERFDVVKAVVAPAEDAEGEVDFGGRATSSA